MDAQLTALIAYQLFEHRGRIHGRHREDWFLAEAIIEAARASVSTTAPAPEVPASPASERGAPPASGPLASASEERDALTLLEQAAAREGRAAVAARLGYGSTSTVAKLLRGERALSAELARRIQELLGAAPAEALRVVPGRAAA